MINRAKILCNIRYLHVTYCFFLLVCHYKATRESASYLSQNFRILYFLLNSQLAIFNICFTEIFILLIHALQSMEEKCKPTRDPCKHKACAIQRCLESKFSR